MEEHRINKTEYNQVPIYYCKKCLSIKVLNAGDDYCDDCGSTEIGSTDINTWEALYKEQYGHKFLEK